VTAGQALGLGASAIVLLLTAALEVAFRSTSRIDLLRWAQVKFVGEEEDKPLTGALEVTYTSVRLARQLSLLVLCVAATVLGVQWLAGWGFPVSSYFWLRFLYFARPRCCLGMRSTSI
jgi:hypothetical protein